MQYMYTTDAEDIEARRLKGLSKLHNPHTLKYLSPLLLGKNKILELACGAGHLAAEILEHAPTDLQYIGVDRDPGQVKYAKENLLQYPNAEIIHLDIIDDIENLRNKGPFDLIYCRWLLVHLPKDIRVEFLRNIFSLLSANGVFLCDECDNRKVKFKPIDPTRATRAPYEQANQFWKEISLNLMRLLNNELEYSSKKIRKDFEAASAGKGEIKTEGQYQVIFRNQNEKRLITDGYRSSAAIVTKACGRLLEELILPFDACVEDDNIEVEFLTENVVTYRAKASL